MDNPLWSYIFRPSKDKRSLLELLKTLPIFENLSTSQLRQVSRSLHERRYREGEAVFQQTDPGAGLYIIQSGRISISRVVEGRQPMELAVYVEGNFFGELALLDEMPRSATATAIEPTELLAFPKPDLDHMVDRNPQLAVKILLNVSRLIAKRLIRANENLESLLARTETE